MKDKEDKTKEEDKNRIKKMLESGNKNDFFDEMLREDPIKVKKGMNHLSLDIEKSSVIRDITLRSVKFGVIVITGAFFISLGNNLAEKLILATPYALAGGKNLRTIDEEIYKLRRINHELKGLKR